MGKFHLKNVSIPDHAPTSVVPDQILPEVERGRTTATPTPATSLDEEDPFAVEAGRFIYGCGAFFALKLQSARSVNQLEEFAKEADNLEKLSGHPHIVQIRDHTILRESLHVVILMELAACDLHTLFQRVGYSPGNVSGMFSIWRSLVKAVDAAHNKEIIHRDLKPQNFLLVPIASPPFADRILATTTTRPKEFQFRIVERALAADSTTAGDVELTLTDAATGTQQVLRLIIKLTDFGLAQPLDLDESHLSVRGHAGTIKYMAPENFQPTTDGLQRLSKRLDVWSLGVMFFQMLHGGRTPYDSYCTDKSNNIRAAVAIASEFVHSEVMIFDRQTVWAAEWKMLQQEQHVDVPGALGNSGAEGGGPMITTHTSPIGVCISGIATEFLFRVCESCLAFAVSDRCDVEDLLR